MRGQTPFAAGGHERRIRRRGGAIDDEARARQRLEGGGQRRVAGPIMRPREAPAQQQRHAPRRSEGVEAEAELAARVGGVLGIVAQPKTASRRIGLAIEWRMERFVLRRCVRGNAEAGPDAVAITGLDPPAVSMAIEARAELIAE